MAYIQGANPFSRRRGKAKREAKRQLKSLYKQGYYQPTRSLKLMELLVIKQVDQMKVNKN